VIGYTFRLFDRAPVIGVSNKISMRCVYALYFLFTTSTETHLLQLHRHPFTMTMRLLLLVVSYLDFLTNAREITFPPVSGYPSQQIVFQGPNDADITTSKFAGLMTYANLPYVHCLALEGQDVEPFDIAIIGAPFDTVSQIPLEDNSDHRSEAGSCSKWLMIGRV
jgi:hypothetical protein